MFSREDLTRSTRSSHEGHEEDRLRFVDRPKPSGFSKSIEDFFFVSFVPFFVTFVLSFHSRSTRSLNSSHEI